MIAFGLGLLRLSPRDFWAMTLRELSCLLGAYRADAAQPPRRSTLTKLMSMFPDTKEGARQ